MQKNTQNQGVKQSQSVMMTPQMQMAMRVLALGQQELSAMLEAEIEANPLLLQDGDVPDGTLEAGEEAAFSALEQKARDKEELTHDEWPDDLNLDRAINEFEAVTLRDHGVEERPNLEHYVADTPSLIKSLREQVYDLNLALDVRACAEQLIYWLDEDGYLRETDDDIAAIISIDILTVRAARRALQGCVPMGLAARDLVDCLAVQLVKQDVDQDSLWLVLNNLEHLTKSGMHKFAHEHDVSISNISEIIARLRQCDARPGRQFEDIMQDVQVPDIVVSKKSGEWIAELNEDLLPSLHIREGLWEELARGGSKPEITKYLQTQRQSARWLQRIVNTRAMSLLRVSFALIAKQNDYLENGISQLRPMTIRELADEVGLNEATVSRVVANKLIEGPFGIVAMRDLFTSSVGQDAQGEAYAAGAVKSRISALIKAEPTHKPLSDDKLVGLLAAEGIPIARRTVTKYREAMGLGSSVERKRQKQFS